MQASGRARRQVNEEAGEMAGTAGLTIDAANEAAKNAENEAEQIEENAENLKDENLKSGKQEAEKKRKESNDKVRAGCCCQIF